MRRLSISRGVLPALALLLVALLAACSGASGTGSAAGTSASGSAAASPSEPVPSDTGAPSEGTGGSGGGGTGGGTGADAQCPKGVSTGVMRLSEMDNGMAVCLAKGSKLDIFLHAKLGQQWSRPTPEQAVLQPYVNTEGALQMGVTAGFFVAASTGQTRVTAQLAPCKGPKPGPACDVIELYSVTVTVR
jgi:hypothetical protein